RVRRFFRGAAEAAIRELQGHRGDSSGASSRPDSGDEEVRAAARELLARERHSRGDGPTEPEPDAVLLDYYASRYGWDWRTGELTDFWWVVRDLPAAARRREALERLADAQHAVLTRGPEGEQEV